MKRLSMLVVILVVAVTGAWAQSYYLVPDVPSTLGAAGDFLPWDIVRNDAGIYSGATAIPALRHMDALFRLGSGDYLISVNAMATLGGLDWDRRDVFLYTTAGTFVGYPPWGGALAQIPPGSDVDAVFLLPTSGDIVVSFDVPTSIGAAVMFDPSDLVIYAGGVFQAVPFFDASANGIPPSVNLTAADVRGGSIFMSFDVPLSVAGATFLPGEIVEHNGIGFVLFDPQPNWPAGRSSHVSGFSFLADPGTIDPSTGLVPQPGLTIDVAGAGTILLQWGASSCGGAEDWGVFEGSLGGFPAYTHVPVTCSTGGVNTYLHAYPPGNLYYLVVPNNLNDEGSEGFARMGGATIDRSGLPVCRPTRVTGCSP